MTDSANIRAERIERLLHELEYEITRGIMEREIDEILSFNFYVPHHDGRNIILCKFETRVTSPLYANPNDYHPRLRLVKK